MTLRRALTACGAGFLLIAGAAAGFVLLPLPEGLLTRPALATLDLTDRAGAPQIYEIDVGAGWLDGQRDGQPAGFVLLHGERR